MKTRHDIARRRMGNQHLVGAPLASPEAVVERLCAVQAQDYAGAKWGVAQRVRRCADSDVDEAFQSGRILRTHVMRPTWHFVMPADIRWMLELTAPRVHAASAYYYRKNELDAATFARSNAALARALQGGAYLTRTELARVLEAAGIPGSGLRLGLLIMRAELDAVICSGPRRGKQFTYALLDERAPGARTLPRDEALAELTHRYFAGHGPSLLRDFAWWSGLTVADAKAGVEKAGRRLTRAVVDGKTYFLAPSREVRIEKPVVHLLPNYDEYLIAYKDHSSVVDAEVIKKVGARDQVFANHIVVVNGQVIGGWRRILEKEAVIVETTLLRKLDRAEKQALKAAGERFGHFLGLPVRMRPA